jgi:hypothetical protein
LVATVVAVVVTVVAVVVTVVVVVAGARTVKVVVALPVLGPPRASMVWGPGVAPAGTLLE